MAYRDLSLKQFIRKFSTEESCLEAISAARWPRGFVCPRCQHNGGFRLSGRRTFQCASCRKQTSITSQTIFHGSHIPLVDWFLAIYLVAQDKGSVSAQRLANQLDMHYPTAWYLLHRLRFAMSAREENLTLAGYIELDEAFFGGKRRNKRTRKGPPKPTEKKAMVLVMVEAEGKQAGNLVMQVIRDGTYDTLKAIVAEKIEADPPGQRFRADGWQAHECVTLFGHQVEMGHIPNSMQDSELPCVSLATTHAKRFLLGTFHQFCKKHLQRYLDEFCYRWNRRHLEGQLASHLLSACALSPRMAAA